MATKKRKSLTVGFAVDKKTAAKLEASGAQALETGHVVVRSGNKLIGTTTGGYETRLWEKVTCDLAMPIIDPEEIVTHPEQFGIEVFATKTPASKLSAKRKAGAKKAKK